MYEAAAVKEARQIQRRAQAHLVKAHQRLGCSVETVGWVEVVLHPTSRDGRLNYVMPRRGTAWVAAASLLPGLERLQAQGRAPRAQYLEALYPPQFGSALAGFGLGLAHRAVLLTYLAPAGAAAAARLPREYEVVLDAAWPADGHDWEALTLEAAPGAGLTLALREQGQPVGAARLLRLDTTALLMAWAAPGRQTPARLQALALAGRQEALAAGASLVYALGPTPAFGQALLDASFAACGDLVSYTVEGERAGDFLMEQPVPPER